MRCVIADFQLPIADWKGTADANVAGRNRPPWGEAIYEQQFRARVEKQHLGEFLVLDVLTGDYEIDRDDLTASDWALAQNPRSVLYGIRIGYQAAYKL